MAVWLVRAGGKGEQQSFALDNSVAVVGWLSDEDLAQHSARELLRESIASRYPDWKQGKINNVTGQLWAFSKRMQVGDIVALPLKDQDAIALGRVAGDYGFRSNNPPGAKHIRPVEWINKELPRDQLEQDLLYSLGAFMTVCQIRRNNAEARIRALLEGKEPPQIFQTEDDDETSDVEATPNLEDYAATEIRTFISQRFVGHGLADLVDEILNAQGYQTEKSDPGPDGGVDIIAGKGALGFDPPRLCVQVKATGSTQDIKVLRELRGVMNDFGAEQGLFVSWSGFKRSVLAEARRQFFQIRLWDATDVIAEVQRHYDKFSDSIKAELPLKRIWIRVQPESDSEI